MVRERISGRDEMGSGGSGEADCSVGSIVWVRRRNGSWWPGKIMGPDELSATHIVSPRTGTPVKLLGREDASVDWYNLEKSKRVKAFRCGEFHECIERAESSLGMPAKKREKYARREDAILHALELEKELLEKEHGQLIASDFKSSKYSDFVKKKLVASSESLRYDNGKHGNADQFSTGSDSYHKDEKVSPLYVPKDKVGNQLGSGDVKSEAIPSMRGLQDFGLKATHSKRKFSYVSSNGSEGPIADNHTYASSCNGVSMGGTSYANSKNLDDIRKMPNEGLTEDIHVKRHDRRRPIVQVPQISARLPASHLLPPDSCNRSLPESGVDQMGNIWRAKRSRCIYLPSEFSDCLGNRESVPNQMETYRAEGDSGIPGSLMEEKPCEFINDEQSESSETEDLDTDSDEETNSLSGSSETDSETPGGSEVQEKHESVGNEDLDELAVSSDLSNIRPHDHAPANAGISEWQVKGKRNVRYLTKKLGVEADGTYMEEKGITFNRRSLEHNALNEAEIIDKDFRTQMIRLNNRGFTLTSKAASDRQNRTGHDIVDWEDLAWEDQLSFQGYMDPGEYPDPVFIGRQHLGGKMRTTLIDVDLKVQASYKKEHVPIVSLMSKLDGKAIIGHPIQIEVLREGSSEFLFATKNDFGNEAHYNGERTLPPLWRTARRTAHSRVRRPLTSSTLVRDKVAEDPPQLGKERKTLFKKPNAWGFRRKESIPIDLKLSRKLPKRVSSSSSQKTRTLSSIGIEQKLRHLRQDGDYPLDGLIKTDSAPPAVACIPVKLVFSRLYEAVGRPPSRASIASHEALINMDTETNPL